MVTDGASPVLYLAGSCVDEAVVRPERYGYYGDFLRDSSPRRIKRFEDQTRRWSRETLPVLYEAGGVRYGVATVGEAATLRVLRSLTWRAGVLGTL